MNKDLLFVDYYKDWIETYLKLANELNMSSGKIVEFVDEYRKRVAPMAQKWWEWKNSTNKEE